MESGEKGRSPLSRLREREWSSEDERRALFRSVTGRADLRLEDVLWTLTAPEPEIRQLGGLILPRFAGPQLSLALLEELKDKNFAQQRILLRHISRCDIADVQAIARKLLNGPDRNRRALGNELISCFSGVSAHQLLKTLLKDSSAEVRLTAAQKVLENFSALDEKALRDDVLDLCLDVDERIRQTVFKAIVTSPRREPAFLSALVRGLIDESLVVQQLCTVALGERIRSGDPALEQRLVQLLFEALAGVRIQVLKALLQSPERERVLKALLRGLLDVPGWMRSQIVQSLSIFRGELADSLLQICLDPDPTLRRSALAVLRAVGPTGSLDGLLSLLDSSDNWTRLAVLEIMGDARDARHLGKLCTLLADQALQVQVIDTIGRSGDPSTISAILPLLNADSVDVRNAAIDALALLRRDTSEREQLVRDALTQVASTSDIQQCRLRAAERLRKLNSRVDSLAQSVEPEVSPLDAQSSENDTPLAALVHSAQRMGALDLYLRESAGAFARVQKRLVALPCGAHTIEHLIREAEAIVKAEQGNHVSGSTMSPGRMSLSDGSQFSIHPSVIDFQRHVLIRRLPQLDPGRSLFCLPGPMTSLVSLKNGLIVFTGPSRCGKSSTALGLLDLICENRPLHAVAIVQHVETVLLERRSCLHWREVNIHTRSVQSALRAALQSSPELVFVDCALDHESTRALLEVASVGILVIAVIPSLSVIGALSKLTFSVHRHEHSRRCSGLARSLRAVLCHNPASNKEQDSSAPTLELLLGTSSVQALINKGAFEEILPLVLDLEYLGMRSFEQRLGFVGGNS